MRIKKIKPYIYLLPALLLAVMFVYYPFIRSIVSSFFNISISGKFNSFCFLDNYKALLTDDVFYLSLKNTFIFMLMFVPLNTILVIALVILFPARLSLVFLGIFLALSIDYLLLLSATRNLDRGPIEAAMVDGCTSRQIFFKIKLPMLLPILSFIVFIAIKDALLICSPIIVMTEGGPARSTQTIVYYYYLSAFKNSAISKAATISTLVFIRSAIILSLYKRFEKRRITF